MPPIVPSGFNQTAFNNFILEHKVIGFFDQPITLKSGRQSNWYVNWRKPSEDVALIDELADHIIDFINAQKLNPDTIYGVPEGATKIGIITQYKWATWANDSNEQNKYVLAMGRGKPKEHGQSEDRFFLGMPKGRTVVIEDVTTTGGSLIETIDNLKSVSVDIVAAIGLTNRMEKRNDQLTVEEVVQRNNVPYYAMSDALELLPLACQRYRPHRDIVRSVEREFNEYGIKPINLMHLLVGGV